MKRSQIEQKLTLYRDEAAKRIESAPIPAFCLALFLGAAMMAFHFILLPLLLVAVLVLVVLWFIGESHEDDDELPRDRFGAS